MDDLFPTYSDEPSALPSDEELSALPDLPHEQDDPSSATEITVAENAPEEPGEPSEPASAPAPLGADIPELVAPGRFAEYRTMTIAELARDSEEIAAFARETGIDPDDPHPGAETLRLLASMLEASAEIGAVITEHGETLCARLDMGTEERRLSAATIERARDFLLDATVELSSAKDALDRAAESFIDRTGSAASALHAGIEASSTTMACRSAELLAGHLSQTIDGAFSAGQQELLTATGAARTSLKSELDSGTERFAQRLLKLSNGEVKKFEAAMSRALVDAEKKRIAANPWRWRLLAVAMAGLVASMGLSWMIGHDLGSKRARAQAVAHQPVAPAPITPRGR